jgi:hypothetical protein
MVSDANKSTSLSNEKKLSISKKKEPNNMWLEVE